MHPLRAAHVALLDAGVQGSVPALRLLRRPDGVPQVKLSVSRVGGWGFAAPRLSRIREVWPNPSDETVVSILHVWLGPWLFAVVWR